MKRTIFFTSMLLTIVLMLALSGCGAALKEAATLSAYEMGAESIPSVTSIVGEREVTGVESGTNNGVMSKQYTYISDTVYDDLLAYVTEMMNQGWLVTQDIDLNVVPGSGELGKKSVDEGQILLVSFTYEDSGYVIKIVKGEGTIE